MVVEKKGCEFNDWAKKWCENHDAGAPKDLYKKIIDRLKLVLGFDEYKKKRIYATWVHNFLTPEDAAKRLEENQAATKKTKKELDEKKDVISDKIKKSLLEAGVPESRLEWLFDELRKPVQVDNEEATNEEAETEKGRRARERFNELTKEFSLKNRSTVRADVCYWQEKQKLLDAKIEKLQNQCGITYQGGPEGEAPYGEAKRFSVLTDQEIELFEILLAKITRNGEKNESVFYKLKNDQWEVLELEDRKNIWKLVWSLYNKKYKPNERG